MISAPVPAARGSGCLRLSKCSAAEQGPPAHLALAVGTQAGRGWICHAGWGRGEWVLLLPAHCTVGMPCLSQCESLSSWGTWEAVCSHASSILTASPVLLLLLPRTGLSAPLWLFWHFLGWRDGEGRGKLSWKQVTCARSMVGMGVAMETSSPNSILHPTPEPNSLKQPERAARQICFIFLFISCVPALGRVLLMKAGVQACQEQVPHSSPIPAGGMAKAMRHERGLSGRDEMLAPMERGN